MEQEEQAKDRQGAKEAAPAIVLPAMSFSPLLYPFCFSLQFSAYRLILHQIIPPHRMPVRVPVDVLPLIAYHGGTRDNF
jgi:hypothetical protein